MSSPEYYENHKKISDAFDSDYRLIGPRYIYNNGQLDWWREDLNYRGGFPDIIRPDGSKYWHVYDGQFSSLEHLQRAL